MNIFSIFSLFFHLLFFLSEGIISTKKISKYKKIIIEDDSQFIDITLKENEKYYNDIKASLRNFTINETKNIFKYHQIFKIFNSTLKNKTLFESYFILNELEDTNFFEVSFKKDYSNESKTNQEGELNLLDKNFEMFSPVNKENEKFKNSISDFLKFRDLDNEYYFYKGKNEHSCGNYLFNTEFPLRLSACTLKERNSNYTFIVGYYSQNLKNNVSNFDNCFYLNKYEGKFEFYTSSIGEKDKRNFKHNEKDSIIISNFYDYLKNNSLIPNYYVDPNSNDNSEGGINIIVRRSFIVIIMTGVFTFLLSLGLFLFAKSKKKIYIPMDVFEKIENSE